ncbi:MAG: RagB/SusD family nutrient uptake outer membrane protein [Zunongwangia sp.]|uniref:Outer membrane protein, probably involved in nutrient binding n=2 Tax=Zunongwangia profunda TaxID=398743 RepID=D5BG85_ZUNPS|nr:RagB/SusD family nutrient uptake outer membrane protein [Zunongwangia profunda]ADF51044.1 putative outer membrane protein, probably involved in nutrient binding [Zunongwangia profunda SM-A87]MAO34724.1 RagB/SusD family nutrient uptake outer membrane protein [Zunongwangia sp.]MAS72822.1 RagB/SusD family nutrient uptake outer membrane protein [Zunongwangia sp.]HCV79660.1 RagB/SusD family nutrient uptake outer membrane protein [Zunongwangia profunda]|tara:strand:+ start:2836 stop:4329 length:1494 start_codon:yes stop_codon:yes gene_type:complete
MKKRNIKKVILGLFLSISFIGCDDLKRFPYDAIEQSQSFQTVNDAATWNNGLYASFRGVLYGQYMFSTDVQADQLNATLDYGNRNGNPHRWEGFLADDYTVRDVWFGYYARISDLNAAIEGMSTIVTDSPEEEAELERYIADAYFARAFYYHNLVVRYASDYDPASASSDLGVPLMLQYDISARPSRSTVEQVYQQILADIDAARPALSQVSGEQGAQRFNADVLTAFEARVKFYMEDWAGAKAAADELINSGDYPLINNQADFRDMWVNDYDQEVIMQVYVEAPNELANTNSIYLGFSGGTGLFTPDFLPTQWMVDLYEDDDIRKDVYFLNDTIVMSSITYTDLFMVNKYPGNPDLWTGANTNYQQAPKVFRIAEMYLISAEAALSISESQALAPLNELRQARGLSAVDASGSALVDAVREERTRELAFEGFRLDDLRRWDLGFTRRDPQNTDPLQPGANYYTKSVEASNPKFIWGVPTNDILINPGLAGEQNPGW